jgi:hypothetical protein
MSLSLIQVVSIGINIILIIAFIYAIYIGNRERELFEKCNFKILCENGYLNQNQKCQDYLIIKRNLDILNNTND